MDLLLRVYERLRRALGGENWWQAESPWEVLVGAILVQQTTWQSVDRALRALKAEGLLPPDVLAHAALERIETCVRPTGTYRTKARRLRLMAARVLKEGTLEAFLARPPGTLRRSLLAIEGVGEETADAILLYAAGYPAPVVDAYTRRILQRLGHPLPRGYERAARQLRAQLPDHVADHRRFHAVMVILGKKFCRPTPRCAPCPLLDLCPHGQAVVAALPPTGL